MYSRLMSFVTLSGVEARIVDSPDIPNSLLIEMSLNIQTYRYISRLELTQASIPDIVIIKAIQEMQSQLISDMRYKIKQYVEKT